MDEVRIRQFEELWRYYNAIVALLMRLGHSREDARDLAQDVFLRVFEHMDTYAGKSRWSFLVTTARRLSSNFYRDARAIKRKAVEVPQEDALDEPDRHVIPADESVQLGEQARRLYEAIAQQPPPDQDLVFLDMAGYTHAEIGNRVGMSAQAVKTRLFQIRAHLRKLLSDDLSWWDR